jgi:AraC-like DNA-binding protein
MIETAPVTITRHSSELGKWEHIRRAPDARLHPYVRSYEGYVETSATFTTRMETPSTGAVMIINFGPPYRVTGPGNARGDAAYGSFVAGMVDAHVLVEATGLAAGMQVNFTAIGAGLFFGVPMAELTNRTVALRDVLGPDGERLEAQLEDTPGWEARFDMLDAFITHRIAMAAPTPLAVAFAMERLTATGGSASIQALADDAGWSRKHLASLFKQHVGLPPKTMARVIRFNRATSLLREHGEVRWVDVALQCGYYDQAHFNRDFRDFTGGTPGEYLRRTIPDGGGILA